MADDVIHEMTTAQVLQKQLFDAHEPNLLDENGKLPLLIFQLFSLVSSTKGPGGTGRFFSATSFWLICVFFFISMIFCGYHMRLYCLLCILLGILLLQTEKREKGGMKGKNERDGGTQKKRAGEECSSEPPLHDPLGPLYRGGSWVQHS